MSTLAIVVIAVVVLLVIAGLAMTVLSPRKRAERRLQGERKQAAEHHRVEAEQRKSQAAVAEQRADEARLQAERVAQDARLEREQAELHERRADLHDRGLADDELGRDTGDLESSRGMDGTASVDGGGRRETDYVDDQRAASANAERPGAVDASSHGRFARDDDTAVERSEDELAAGDPQRGSARRPMPPRS